MGVQRERKEQEYLVQWFKLKYRDILIVASANGGARDPRQGAHMKREGVCAGFPDLGIYKACKGYHGLFIELKAPKTATQPAGRLSPLQKLRLAQLNAEGYLAVARWGWLEGKETIDAYLEYCK